MFHSFTQILISTVFNFDNNKRFSANQNIRTISERSCEAEDWSNDAENFSFDSLE